jgi:hypothetical protein
MDILSMLGSMFIPKTMDAMKQGGMKQAFLQRPDPLQDIGLPQPEAGNQPPLPQTLGGLLAAQSNAAAGAEKQRRDAIEMLKLGQLGMGGF